MTSELPDGWTRRRLADCGTWLSGGTPPKSQPEYWGGDIPWVGPKDLHVRYVEDAEERLTETGAANGTRLAPENTILIVVRSMALAKRLQIAFTRRQVAFNQDIKAILPDDGVRPRFLFYALWGSHDALHGLVDEASHGTKRLRTEVLADYVVSIPPASEQERIEMVLAALDDRIDSNRRLARLLENAVAALFRGRFVDFVGIEEFEESDVGPIPRGWSLGSIYDIATVTYGRPFKSNQFNPEEGVPVLRIRDLASDQPSVLTTEERTDARLIHPGDIVVGMDGEFRAHIWSGPASWLNQRVCTFDPRDGISRAFVLEAVKPPLRFFEATKGGTTVIHLGKRDIDTFRLVIPPASVMNDFGREADTMLAHAVALRVECRSLGAIRDLLLPKLISGEIRVPDSTDPAETVEPLAEEHAG